MKLPKFLFRYKATLAYIVLIVGINSLFSFAPLISLFGESFSSADITVGAIYIFRDFSQREIKNYVLIAMLLGGALSYIFAQNSVAFASLLAFIVGEFIDWILFTCTRKPLSQRLLLSSLCSCPVDSVVFLYFIGRLNWLELTLLTLIKFLGVFLVWWYWRIKRPLRPFDELRPDMQEV